MSEPWRIARTYPSLGGPLAEIREGGPEGGSRFVCEATPEDAEHIVSLHNASLAASYDRAAPEAKIDGWKASYRAAMEQADEWHRMYANERERRVALEAALSDYRIHGEDDVAAIRRAITGGEKVQAEVARYRRALENIHLNVKSLAEGMVPTMPEDAIWYFKMIEGVCSTALAAPAERRGEG